MLVICLLVKNKKTDLSNVWLLKVAIAMVATTILDVTTKFFYI